MKELLATDDFKPNCAMVVLDFLIRHSFIEPDTGLCTSLDSMIKSADFKSCVDLLLLISEPYYQEFVAGLHQTL